MQRGSKPEVNSQQSRAWQTVEGWVAGVDREYMRKSMKRRPISKSKTSTFFWPELDSYIL